MCGRFTLHHPADEVVERFAVDQAGMDLAPRYNIAPSQPVAVVLQRDTRVLEAFKWGLVPSWAKDPKIGNRMINARGETLGEKPAYRNALKRRRCLIPASGFYEWKKAGDQRLPTYIHRRDTRLLALAGLWEEWHPPEGDPLHSCTIITTSANEFMAGIHHRMPVIFHPEQEAAWLDPELQEVDDLVALLQPDPDPDLEAHPVSRQVNRPGFDDPACIQPVENGD